MKLTVKEKLAAHTFVTQAIAGAGASNVGIAGSAAIAVIHGDTAAYVMSANAAWAAAHPMDHDLTIAGDVVLNAVSRQDEKTTASSSVGSDGMADQNLSAGSGSDAANGGTDRRTQAVGTTGEVSLSATGGTATPTLVSTGKYSVKLAADEGYDVTATTVTITYTKVTPGTGGNPDTEETVSITAPITAVTGEDYTYTFTFNLPDDVKDGT